METINLTSTQAIIYLAIFGAVVGLILGGIALIIARKRGKAGLGFGALITCVLLGAATPVLAIIAFVVFLIFILKRPKQVVVNEEPIEVPVSDPKES
jgi:hypothetical protein